MWTNAYDYGHPSAVKTHCDGQGNARNTRLFTQKRWLDTPKTSNEFHTVHPHMSLMLWFKCHCADCAMQWAPSQHGHNWPTFWLWRCWTRSHFAVEGAYYQWGKETPSWHPSPSSSYTYRLHTFRSQGSVEDVTGRGTFHPVTVTIGIGVATRFASGSSSLQNFGGINTSSS